ncbi:MAG: hypothetical protein GY805_10005 [Chloroflexi bacterium]|nr:hypothetical protein [Chloroflexota bacterium]
MFSQTTDETAVQFFLKWFSRLSIIITFPCTISPSRLRGNGRTFCNSLN